MVTIPFYEKLFHAPQKQENTTWYGVIEIIDIFEELWAYLLV